MDRKEYWDKIYSTKSPEQVSWHQEYPATSLKFIEELNLSQSAKIFDNGAGDSYLVDNLLKRGFNNITVQDISNEALLKVKKRLGTNAEKIRWIVDDEAHCNPGRQYDLWHDRAAFHFLTEENEITEYVHTLTNCIKPGGYFVIATFSESGPQMCSGLKVKQYSELKMEKLLASGFRKVKCINEDHITPFNTKQNFLFCTFKREQLNVNNN